MKTIRVTIYVVLITAAASFAAYPLAIHHAALAFSSADCGRPIAVFTATGVDLGKVHAGGTVDAVFEVRNAGTRRLFLRESATTCECLAPARPEIVVGARSSAKLTVRLDTGHARGPLKLQSRYKTNDPNRPLVTLTLLADVQPP